MKRICSILLLAIGALPMMGQKDLITTTDNYKIEAAIISVTDDSIGYTMPGVPVTLSLPTEQIAHIVYRTGDTVRYHEMARDIEEKIATNPTALEITFDIDIAAVHSFHGIYVYTDCQPLDEYQVLGVVTYTETKGAVSAAVFGHYGAVSAPVYAQYTSLRDGLVRRALETYSEAQGIIIEADGEGKAIARVIKYKREAESRFARVKMIDGYYIYIDNHPTTKSLHLGTVSVTFGESTYTSVRNKLIKKAHVSYGTKANALVISLKEGRSDMASVRTLSREADEK